MADKTTTSFMRSLCMGHIEQDVLFPFPTLSADQKETLHEIAGALEDLLGPRAEDFRQWDVDGEMPPDFIDELKEFGLFGLIIPEAHGGLGLGNMAYSRTLQEVGRYDASVAVTIGAHSSIGMRGLLLLGTEEQKNRYMPRLASGELIAAFCLTETGRRFRRSGHQDDRGEKRRRLAAQWQQAVDHQRWIRRIFHGLCPHRSRRGPWQDDGIHRDPGHGGRQHRAARRQDGPACQFHHHGVVR